MDRYLPSIAFIVLGLVYSFVGLVLATIYNWLAGPTDYETRFKTALVLPAVIVVLIIIGTLGYAVRMPWYRTAFWLLLCYCLLPILLRATSAGLAAFHYDRASEYIFAARYYSLLSLPFVIMVILTLGWVLEGIRLSLDRNRKNIPPICV